jgi:hypothetical protein
MEGEKRNVSDVLSWRYNRSVVARHGFFSAHRHATNDLGRRRIDRDLSVRLYIFFTSRAGTKRMLVLLDLGHAPT